MCIRDSSIIEGTISSMNDYAIYLRIDGFDLDGFLHANDLSYDKNPEEEIKKLKVDYIILKGSKENRLNKVEQLI